MFHSRAMEDRINRIHERTLTLIYPNQHTLTFKELLEKNKTIEIIQRNSKTLATEIYKTKNKISPEVVNSLLEFFFLSGFSFTNTDDSQDSRGKGGDHLLFHSTTSTRSRTFRHLFATLHVR